LTSNQLVMWGCAPAQLCIPTWCKPKPIHQKCFLYAFSLFILIYLTFSFPFNYSFVKYRYSQVSLNICTYFCISKKTAKRGKMLAWNLTCVTGCLLLMSPKKNKSFKRRVIKCLEKDNEKLATNSMEKLSLYLRH